MTPLEIVSQIIGSPKAYKPSPTYVSWQACIPGDCTELTMMAKVLLNVLEIPLKDMHIYICKTETGQKHAVLLVNYKGQEKIIDCRYAIPIDKDILLYTQWQCMDEWV